MANIMVNCQMDGWTNKIQNSNVLFIQMEMGFRLNLDYSVEELVHIASSSFPQSDRSLLVDFPIPDLFRHHVPIEVENSSSPFFRPNVNLLSLCRSSNMCCYLIE